MKHLRIDTNVSKPSRIRTIFFPVSQAPPVGSYDVKTRKQGLAPGFGKGKRFNELKGECKFIAIAERQLIL